MSSTDNTAESPTQTSTKNLSVRVDDHQSKKLKALAYDYGDCSQSAVLRTCIEEYYDDVFGDLDPNAIDRGAVSDAELRQITNGADAATVVDDELLVDGDVSETAETTSAVGDGGAVVSPDSYSMTLGPDDLAQSGPELTWDKLKDVVADDSHWSDELEIHPDRVPADELKSNHRYTPRIIVAILRHKSTDGGFVPGKFVNHAIDDYLLDLHNRADENEGREYIRNTYRPLIVDKLFAAPNPRIDAYYTTLDEQVEAAEDIIEIGIELPDNFETGDAVIDVERWHTTNGYEESTKQTISKWIKDVAELLESVAQIKASTTQVEALRKVAVDYPDTYDNKVSYLKMMWTKWCNKFAGEVDSKHRKGVVQEMHPEAVDILNLD